MSGNNGNGNTATTAAVEALMRKLSQDLDASGNVVKGLSESERNSRQILAALDALGGQTVGEDSLVFFGTQFILPASMEGDIESARRFLRDWDEQQNTEFSFSRQYNFRPYDGAAAFDRAMKRVFGTSGIGKATQTLFGSNPPEYVTIDSAVGETIQVPWGEVTFSPIQATFQLGYTRDRTYGIVFVLAVEAPRKHRRRVEGFFKVVEDELAAGSIYKGKAITSDPLMPKFLDVSKIDPDQIIYTQDVLTQLDVNMWAPLRYTQAMREAGVPLKRAILVEGPNGTGKTLAGLRTAQIAQENGWTFILTAAGEDPLEALKTAQIYAPAVVWVEDLDVIAATDAEGSSRKKVSKVLDTLDGLQGKGSEVMAGFTTNFVDKLDKGVLRPGRLDAVIHIAELDAEGYGKLVRALIRPELLDPEVDMPAVAAAFEGFLPAFASEAVTRAIRYSVARNAGKAGTITTEDLTASAQGTKAHRDLMENAQHTGADEMTLDDMMTEVVTAAVEGVKGSNNRIGDITFSADED